MLVLTAADVRELLDLDRLVDTLGVAMIDLSDGRVSMPPRVAAEVAGRHGMLATMPAFLPSANALVTKLVTLFPDNRDRPTHQAVIGCFDPETGTPLALMDGTYITAARTAAGSALATRLLACSTTAVVSVIGSGVQARAHARAMSRLPGVRRIQLAARDPDKRDLLLAQLAGDGVETSPAGDIEQAVRSADIVCLTTHSPEPVLHRDWLQPGTHINSVGYNTNGSGEVDLATIRDALIAVESRAAVLAAPPSGSVEIRSALDAGVVNQHDLVEIGELGTGRARGRSDERQLTLYKSVGIAAQDAAAASLVLEAAAIKGSGQQVALS
jgi:ornithine cyclodeaminase/alanine dehydrogenase-like protein (mu-crystallin family)